MPLQNRVTPNGDIIKSSSRGIFLGNRGILHKNKVIVKAFTNKAWITCLTEFKGRKRELMQENYYTELFFLDEATAFAAGHRPCCECRKDRFKLFKELWVQANGKEYNCTNKSPIKTIDNILHGERIDSIGKKITYNEMISNLPNGVIFKPMNSELYCLWQNKIALQWNEDGYHNKVNLNTDDYVEVITPKSIVKVFEMGYDCYIHETAKKLLPNLPLVTITITAKAVI